MAFPLPLPLKVAAGLVVTGVERIRSLPADLSALPVQAAGYALRLSMKVQQEIAELATKGDETLGAVFGGSQPERSPLATFDDDLPAPPRPTARANRVTGPVEGIRRSGGPGARDSSPAGPPDAGSSPRPTAPARPGRRGVPPTVPVVPPGATIDGEPVPGAEAPGTAATDPATTADTATDRTAGAPTEAAGSTPAASDTAVPADWSVTREDPLAERAERADDAPAADEPAPLVTEEPDPVVWTTATDEPIAGPPDIVVPLPLPDYDQLTVAQVRGHLRRLTADDVQTLLEHEQRKGGRAPFLTLLSNRLVTLQHSS